ncbi:hypothetical protein HG536_0D02120 [Torulaspora globosa]|uniref:Uncharacterized protein n=1 Tax=Torulaspora globosa TaxID=48254 RepID=A0A7G3ZGQ4_9SACH|nr:uncharacterized protein HG536_0D02120 [Torulaspora globosa]QLL32690.1 hypothetical protein HG536_0D02120 [Torulaspora globosa]
MSVSERVERSRYFAGSWLLDASMDVQRLPLPAVYELAQEYRNHAYAVSKRVKTESQLSQYYTLISMAIRVLRYIKQAYPLSIEQDARATFDLVDLLLKETHDLDMAESYLSSLRERLLNHQMSGSRSSVMGLRMHCELLLLCRVPTERNTKFHYKAALRSCEQLLKYLIELKDTDRSFEDWIEVFRYVSLSLNRKLGKHSIVKAKYAELSEVGSHHVQWRSFITLTHVNYLLNNRLPVPLPDWQRLDSIRIQDVPPRWYAWKLLLELVMQIYEDKNITQRLLQFKALFAEYKTSLDYTCDDCNVEMAKGLTLSLNSSFLLSYKDIKNLLLLLQSVSYLVNCHDKKANFSIKFLAKVMSSTKKSLEAPDILNDCSIGDIDVKVSWYAKVLSLSQFYQVWQNMLLVAEAPSLPNQHISNKHQSELLIALSSHLSHEDELLVCQQYEALTESIDVSNEIRLIALVNSYLIRTTLVSRNVGRQEQAKLCNSLWEQIVKCWTDSDLRNSTTLDCTLTMVWIMSHFEPFTSNPMPAGESDKSQQLEKLRQYYFANKLSLADDVPSRIEPEDIAGDSVEESLSLKKGLMMQILLNYLGGRLFEQDLETICQISAKCYRLAKLQNFPIVFYAVGFWHLTNCTIAMKTKEATIMSAKLEALEKKLQKHGL